MNFLHKTKIQTKKQAKRIIHFIQNIISSRNLIFLSLGQRFAFEENKNKKVNRFTVVKLEQNHLKKLSFISRKFATHMKKDKCRRK